MPSKTLREWTARRAGAGITVTGTNEHGEPDKIIGVEFITGFTAIGDGRVIVIAIDRSGGGHRLLVESVAAAD